MLRIHFYNTNSSYCHVRYVKLQIWHKTTTFEFANFLAEMKLLLANETTQEK